MYSLIRVYYIEFIVYFLFIFVLAYFVILGTAKLFIKKKHYSNPQMLSSNQLAQERFLHQNNIPLREYNFVKKTLMLNLTKIPSNWSFSPNDLLSNVDDTMEWPSNWDIILEDLNIKSLDNIKTIGELVAEYHRQQLKKNKSQCKHPVATRFLL